MISTYFQSLTGKMKAVFKRYTSSKVHYFFDLKDFKQRANEEEKFDDISLIVGQFSMTIFHTGYLHRLSDIQSCLCCYDELRCRQHGK